ncbi:MAG: ABC transporter permease, partial [Planctomycetota bacterium]
EAFSNNATVGYNLVVGPKGSPLQLTLNSVYYLSQPIENLPFETYMEFFSADERAAMVRQYGGDPSAGDRDGKYSAFVAGGYAIPLALGDYFGEFRVVGTTPDFFKNLRYGPTLEREFVMRDGRSFETYTAENGLFEAVLGSRVAAEMNMKVGDDMYPTHGDPEGKGHAESFKIVGVMAPTGTPNDRAAFVNLEGFYLMENHAKPLEENFEITPPSEPIGGGDGPKPLSIPEREVTSILVRNGSLMMAPIMQNTINESLQAQAAAPVGVITRMLNQFVGPLMWVLLVITLITCVVAAVGVLVAIYNSMNDRRRDIAVMRALGARRDTVTTVIVLESLMVAVIGGFFGWVLAHLGLHFFGGPIEEQTGVQVGFLSVHPWEGVIVGVVLALATFAALLPAAAAYRTDVGTNLAG